jgi:hypothetical protein
MGVKTGRTVHRIPKYGRLVKRNRSRYQRVSVNVRSGIAIAKFSARSSIEGDESYDPKSIWLEMKSTCLEIKTSARRTIFLAIRICKEGINRSGSSRGQPDGFAPPVDRRRALDVSEEYYLPNENRYSDMIMQHVNDHRSIYQLRWQIALTIPIRKMMFERYSKQYRNGYRT